MGGLSKNYMLLDVRGGEGRVANALDVQSFF